MPATCSKIIKHFREKLQYDTKHLPTQLLPCLAVVDGGKQAGGSGSDSVAAGETLADSCSSAASVGQTQAAEVLEPTKKVRKFSKPKTKGPKQFLKTRSEAEAKVCGATNHSLPFFLKVTN